MNAKHFDFTLFKKNLGVTQNHQVNLEVHKYNFEGKALFTAQKIE